MKRSRLNLARNLGYHHVMALALVISIILHGAMSFRNTSYEDGSGSRSIC